MTDNNENEGELGPGEDLEVPQDVSGEENEAMNMNGIEIENGEENMQENMEEWQMEQQNGTEEGVINEGDELENYENMGNMENIEDMEGMEEMGEMGEMEVNEQEENGINQNGVEEKFEDAQQMENFDVNNNAENLFDAQEEEVVEEGVIHEQHHEEEHEGDKNNDGLGGIISQAVMGSFGGENIENKNEIEDEVQKPEDNQENLGGAVNEVFDTAENGEQMPKDNNQENLGGAIYDTAFGGGNNQNEEQMPQDNNQQKFGEVLNDAIDAVYDGDHNQNGFDEGAFNGENNENQEQNQEEMNEENLGNEENMEEEENNQNNFGDDLNQDMNGPLDGKNIGGVISQAIGGINENENEKQMPMEMGGEAFEENHEEKEKEITEENVEEKVKEIIEENNPMTTELENEKRENEENLNNIVSGGPIDRKQFRPYENKYEPVINTNQKESYENQSQPSSAKQNNYDDNLNQQSSGKQNNSYENQNQPSSYPHMEHSEKHYHPSNAPHMDHQHHPEIQFQPSTISTQNNFVEIKYQRPKKAYIVERRNEPVNTKPHQDKYQYRQPNNIAKTNSYQRQNQEPPKQNTTTYNNFKNYEQLKSPQYNMPQETSKSQTTKVCHHCGKYKPPTQKKVPKPVIQSIPENKYRYRNSNSQTKPKYEQYQLQPKYERSSYIDFSKEKRSTHDYRLRGQSQPQKRILLNDIDNSNNNLSKYQKRLIKHKNHKGNLEEVHPTTYKRRNENKDKNYTAYGIRNSSNQKSTKYQGYGDHTYNTKNYQYDTYNNRQYSKYENNTLPLKSSNSGYYRDNSSNIIFSSGNYKRNQSSYLPSSVEKGRNITYGNENKYKTSTIQTQPQQSTNHVCYKCGKYKVGNYVKNKPIDRKENIVYNTSSTSSIPRGQNNRYIRSSYDKGKRKSVEKQQKKVQQQPYKRTQQPAQAPSSGVIKRRTIEFNKTNETSNREVTYNADRLTDRFKKGVTNMIKRKYGNYTNNSSNNNVPRITERKPLDNYAIKEINMSTNRRLRRPYV